MNRARHALQPLRTLIAAACLTLVAAPVSAAESVPLDPKEVLSDLERAYRTRPTSERIEITARADGRQNAEPVSIWIRPDEGFRLELGELTIVANRTLLRAVHRQDAKGYFEREVVGGDILSAVSAALPPLPLPQLALAFGHPHPDPGSLTPYTTSVRWDKAELRPDEQPPIALLHGVGDRCDVELSVDAESGRLVRASIRLDGDRSEIGVRCEPIADSPAPDLALASHGRERVPAISDLRFRPADVAIGDRLPELAILSSDADAPPPGLKGPGVILFMRGWSQSAADCVAAVAAARSGALADLGFWPVAVLEDLANDAQEQIDSLRPLVAPAPLCVTRSAMTTALRFAPAAGAVAVVIDRSGAVRSALVLEPTVPARPALPALAQAQKPDPARSAELARRIRAALGEDAALIGP